MRSKHIGILLCFLVLGFSHKSYGSPDSDDINKKIFSQKAHWRAEDTNISSLSQEERRKRLGLIKKPSFASIAGPTSSAGASTPVFDWRNYGGFDYVTPVKDQGQCGSCWAFAATAALEANLLITKRLSTALSEQILVSCAGEGDCSGGYLDGASAFIQSTGLPPSTFYPYTGTNGSCASATSGWQAATYKISQWIPISPTVSAIENALATYGPLTTTLEIYSDFYYYKGGVYELTAGATYEGSHAVIIVGYDDANQYFIAKNSWGTSWGEKGFFQIAYSQMETVIAFGDDTSAYESSSVVLSPPGGPVNLVAAAGNQQVALSWGAVSGASSYNLYRSTSAGGEGSTAYHLGVTETSFTDVGLSDGTAYYYEVTAVNSHGESGRSTEVHAMPDVTGTDIAIDAGGKAAGSFVADTEFSGGDPFSTGATINTSGVTNPAPQAVYQSERFGNFIYTISDLTPSASYTVRLHFAEIYWTKTGQRLFNVLINGTQVLTNFDIFATAGGEHIAIAESFSATANASGAITIQFVSVKDNAKLSGLEILSAPPPPTDIAIDAGGGVAGSFVADADFSGGSTYASTGAVNTTHVTSPAPQAVYQSERYGNFTYTIPKLIPAASYTIRLHFAEIYFTKAGQRVFNVAINGTPVLTKFDVFAAAGGQNIAIVESFSATASAAGAITIQFVSVTNNSKLSGLEVLAP